MAKALLLTLTGALFGHLYYIKIACVGGTCAITSNPIFSTIYGTFLGYLCSVVFTGKKKQSTEVSMGNDAWAKEYYLL